MPREAAQRQLLVIVAAVMTPIAFAGGAADITRSWVRRWIEFTGALIASKLLLVIILMIGMSVFEGAGMQTTPDGQTTSSQAGTQLAAGAVLLLLAGFAPWIAIKMFQFAGDSLHVVHSQAVAASSGTRSFVIPGESRLTVVAWSICFHNQLDASAAAEANERAIFSNASSTTCLSWQRGSMTCHFVHAIGQLPSGLVV
jgi:hypothetical protein